MKNGSTSGDKFAIAIPLPDAGMLGFDFGSSSQHSSSTCREEIKRLETSSFVQSYGEYFDSACGKTMAGQYEACLDAQSKITKITSQTAAQAFACVPTQSSRNLVISLKYQPATGEDRPAYAVKDISGIPGMECEKNIAPGTATASSMLCKLPETYNAGVAIVKLVNGVTCDVPVSSDIKAEIASAKRFSCSNVFSSLELPGSTNLVHAVVAGLCEVCMAVNLATPETDQRPLKNRFLGCAAWALQTSLIDARPDFCRIVPTPDGAVPLVPSAGYLMPNGGISVAPMGNPFNSVPIAPGFPASTPATVIETTTFGEISDPQAQLNRRLAAEKLCVTRASGQAIALSGSNFQTIPIDFVSSPSAQTPQIKDLLKRLEERIK